MTRTGPFGGSETIRVGGRLRPLPDRMVAAAVQAVLRGERRRAEISVTFLGRDAMGRLNGTWFGHDRPTDVIAFMLPGRPGVPMGDIYICPWMAAREAHRHRVPLRQELIRLVVHGTLHVLGWDHPDGERRIRSPMWRRQERYVADLT